MKIYFLSSIPCALSVNGAYFGITDLFPRHANAFLKDKLFITFTPENACPISFFLDENILFHAPSGVEVYRAPSFIALYAFGFSSLDFTLRTHAQLRTDTALCTVFSQGETQCCLQTDLGAFTYPLPPSFQTCQLTAQGDFFLLRSADSLAIFHKNGRKLFLDQAVSFTLEENLLKVVSNLSSHLSPTAETSYLLTETGAEQIDCVLQSRFPIPPTHETKNGEPAPHPLLSYAFFESVRLGLDLSPYLCEELLSRQDELKSFLKDFEKVALTRNENECALVYKKGERYFHIDFFQTEIQNGKIIDVKG